MYNSVMLNNGDTLQAHVSFQQFSGYVTIDGKQHSALF